MSENLKGKAQVQVREVLEKDNMSPHFLENGERSRDVLLGNQEGRQRSLLSFRRSRENTPQRAESTISDHDSATQSPISTSGKFLKIFRNSFQKTKRRSSDGSAMPSMAPLRETESVENKESYALTIPTKPLPVMEINDLIKQSELEKAYVNLLSFRQEVWFRKEANGDEMSCQKTNLTMLYMALRDKLTAIVRDSQNKELLVHVACIIQEEEKRAGEPGGIGGWREAWRTAILDSVRDTLEGVHLENREQNISWLAVHLGLLGKDIVKDLGKVKAELQCCYPPSFETFETYVMCWHEVVGQHVKKLMEKATEGKDYYAMLNFIINSYHSETIMCNSSLQPDIKEVDHTLPVEAEFLEQLKSRYCTCLQEEQRNMLQRIIDGEKNDVWKVKKMPEEDNGFLHSEIHIDILGMIKSFTNSSGKIDEGLSEKVLSACLEELKLFPNRFGETFFQLNCSLLNSDALDLHLWLSYHIAYINTFSLLKEQMGCHRQSCLVQVEQLEREVDVLVQRLSDSLMEQFKNEVKVCMRNMMTKTWLDTDKDFNELVDVIDLYTVHSNKMRQPQVQKFVNCIHYHVVMEYASKLVMSKFSCKRRKSEGATKLNTQWEKLRMLFHGMGSNLLWLNPLGVHLSTIIGESRERNIKEHFQALVEDYPDIRKKHISAIMNFRDNSMSFEKQKILFQFSELKENSNNEHSFFSEIKMIPATV